MLWSRKATVLIIGTHLILLFYLQADKLAREQAFVAEQEDDEPMVQNVPEATSHLPPPVPAATSIPEQPVPSKAAEPSKEPKFGLEVKKAKGVCKLLLEKLP